MNIGKMLLKCLSEWKDCMINLVAKLRSSDKPTLTRYGIIVLSVIVTSAFLMQSDIAKSHAEEVIHNQQLMAEQRAVIINEDKNTIEQIKSLVIDSDKLLKQTDGKVYTVNRANMRVVLESINYGKSLSVDETAETSTIKKDYDKNKVVLASLQEKNKLLAEDYRVWYHKYNYQVRIDEKNKTLITKEMKKTGDFLVALGKNGQ